MTITPGQFTRDASDRLTFEVHSLAADCYERTCKRIARKYRLQPATELIVGIDEMFRDYTDGTQTIGLEWDIWSGFISSSRSSPNRNLWFGPSVAFYHLTGESAFYAGSHGCSPRLAFAHSFDSLDAQRADIMKMEGLSM